MEIIPIEVFGVAIDVPFTPPLGFNQAKLEEFGAKACDPAHGLGLRPDQIRVRRTDELYQYELTANFFGENGSLTRTAERIKFAIRNGRNAADWNLVHQTLVRFYGIMEFPETSLTTLSAHVHARFPSTDERDSFLGQFSRGFEVVRPAGIGYVRIMDWEKDIRVLMEQSNVVPDSLFIAWDTQFTNLQDWDTFLSTLPTMMENAANVFGIGFEPLKQG